MNNYILYLKTWFEGRDTRERFLVLFLAWAFLYFLFYFMFNKSLENSQITSSNEIQTLEGQITSWNKQIDTLNKVASSPLYKQWLAQHKQIQDLQGQYKNILKSASINQWSDIIKNILHRESNISLVQIKNLPEQHFKDGKNKVSNHIFVQRFNLAILSNYFDTIQYLHHMEQTIPTIHWDGLHYTVIQYPVGKVEMEFSIFYEKNK